MVNWAAMGKMEWPTVSLYSRVGVSPRRARKPLSISTHTPLESTSVPSKSNKYMLEPSFPGECV